MDDSSNVNGNGAGLIRTNPDGEKFSYDLNLKFRALNNVAEYKALLAGLRFVKELGHNI